MADAAARSLAPCSRDHFRLEIDGKDVIEAIGEWRATDAAGSAGKIDQPCAAFRQRRPREERLQQNLRAGRAAGTARN